MSQRKIDAVVDGALVLEASPGNLKNVLASTAHFVRSVFSIFLFNRFILFNEREITKNHNLRLL